jgi:hypothetical protein
LSRDFCPNTLLGIGALTDCLSVRSKELLRFVLQALFFCGKYAKRGFNLVRVEVDKFGSQFDFIAAKHIVDTKAGHFDPKKFDDRYEDELRELLKKKQSGEPIERPQEHEPSKVINLMDALRRSVEAGGARGASKPLAKSAPRKLSTAAPQSGAEPVKSARLE